jgi:ABC-type spermidine/putrescine transport system permease subunit II
MGEAQALTLAQLAIPILMPFAVSFTKRWIPPLEGSAALWVNMVLNVICQIVAAAGGDIQTALAVGSIGGLAGSGGFSAMRSVKDGASRLWSAD